MHAGEGVGVLKAASARPSAFDVDDAVALDLLSKMLGASMHWATRYGKDDLFFRATHDDLTGLANRALFMDRLRLAATQVTRQASAIAVLAVDMDGLKQINDVHGHAAGDAALVAFGELLTLTAREADTVARVGGDEFALLLAPFHGPEGLKSAIDRFQSELSCTCRIDGIQLTLKGSVGGAVCPTDGTELSQLLAVADQRMYEAKRLRKSLQAH
jgi:diguanylate cyclase (GGDEF)-like protein